MDPGKKTKARQHKKNKPAKKATTHYVKTVQDTFQAQLTKLKHRVESLEHRKKKKGLSPEEKNHIKNLRDTIVDKEEYFAAKDAYLKERRVIKHAAHEAAASAMPKRAAREMHADWSDEMRDRHSKIRGMPKGDRSEAYAKFYQEHNLPDTRKKTLKRGGKARSVQEAKEKLKDLKDEAKELNREMDRVQNNPAAEEAVGQALADNLEQQANVASAGADQAQREGDTEAAKALERVAHKAEEKRNQVTADMESRYRPTAFGGALSGRGMLSRWG